MIKQILFTTFLFAQVLTTNAQTPGNSLSFDGADDYVTATLPTVFNDINANNFTIETWIKPEAASFQRILFAQLDASNFVALTVAADYTIYFYVNNLSISNQSTTSLAAGQWSHVACTWNSNTQQIEIYINGVLETLTSGGTSSTGTNNIMTIGSRPDGNQYFTGELDELRIWDDIRTPCEINGAMNSEFNVAQTNLVAYYNFNNGVAGGANPGITTLSDFSTNYDGTLLNFALTGATSNWLASTAPITLVNNNAGSVSTDVQVVCDSLVWIDGITYTADNNSAMHTYIAGASNGCDSTVTLNLTVNNSSTSSITETALDLYTAPSGATYTSSGNYMDTISNAAGCDSIISIALTMSHTGLNELMVGNTELVEVYPNPSVDYINIDINENLLNSSYEMFDQAGRLILKGELIELSNRIDINQLKSGFYYLTIGEHHSLKIVKE